MDRPDSTQGDRHDTLLFVRRAAGGDGDGVTHRHSGRIPLTLVLVVTLLYLSMRGWPQTSARDPHDAGTSGILRVVGAVPPLGWPAFAVTSVWMLAAMVVAVRQALDYRSTSRAITVCALGWLLSLSIAAIIGIVFPAIVS